MWALLLACFSSWLQCQNKLLGTSLSAIAQKSYPLSLWPRKQSLVHPLVPALANELGGTSQVPAACAISRMFLSYGQPCLRPSDDNWPDGLGQHGQGAWGRCPAPTLLLSLLTFA